MVIERNRIHDCGRLPATNKDHGIYVVDARNTVIRDNWIYDNADRGIQLYPDAQRTRIVGNVIDGNGEGIIFGGTGGVTSNHNLVKGNVITNSKLRWNVSSGPTGPTARGNLVLQNCLWAGDSKPHYRSNGGILDPVAELHREGEHGRRPAVCRSRRPRLPALVGQPLPGGPTHSMTPGHRALDYLRRVIEGSELNSPVTGTHPVVIDDLVSPLRYDILVRQQYFEFLAQHHTLYDRDFPELVELSRQHPYFAWFTSVLAPQYMPDLLAGHDGAIRTAFADKIASVVDSVPKLSGQRL